MSLSRYILSQFQRTVIRPLFLPTQKIRKTKQRIKKKKRIPLCHHHRITKFHFQFQEILISNSPDSFSSPPFPLDLDLDLSVVHTNFLESSNNLDHPPNPSVWSEMSTGELLSIEPIELKFPFELKKQISCSLQLSNKTDSYVAFKVKTTNPKKYCVRPNTGVVLPRSTCDVMVTMQAQKEAPADMQCKDKFLLQSVKTNDGVTQKDITAEMFNKEAGHVVEESKLRVVYVPPPQPPSPVPEGSEEGSSPRGSVSENGNVSSTEFAQAARGSTERFEAQDKSSEARALISRLTEEKNNAIQQNNKLRQELELLKREGNKNHGGVSFVVVFLIGLLGIIMGYLMKKT